MVNVASSKLKVIFEPAVFWNANTTVTLEVESAVYDGWNKSK